MEVRAKKELGQHFLTDQGIARAIVGALAASATAAAAPDPAGPEMPGRATGGPGGAGVEPSGPETAGASAVRSEAGRPETRIPVLEVGPGTGVLTQYLLERPELELTAVELDGESVAYLHKHYPALEGRLLQGDFLKMDLGDLFPEKFLVIGNFPYNISSQVFFKILEHRDRIPEVVGMVQKEVAERIAEKPGTRTYGILSVLLQAWYDIEYLFPVGSGAFNPPPKVQSAVIRLRRNARQSLGCDEKLFKTVVKTAFGQRRKTLRNSLRPLIPPKIAAALHATDAPELSDPVWTLRPERLGVEDFIALTRRFEA